MVAAPSNQVVSKPYRCETAHDMRQVTRRSSREQVSYPMGLDTGRLRDKSEVPTNVMFPAGGVPFGSLESSTGARPARLTA
jgi:hypothetical protein